jgi:hemin uptake protein HemP
MTPANHPSEPDSVPKKTPPEAGSEKVVRAEELFGERREIWIELDGVRYRLRITRRGKLILQK